jgi:hypothetical protein
MIEIDAIVFNEYLLHFKYHRVSHICHNLFNISNQVLKFKKKTKLELQNLSYIIKKWQKLFNINEYLFAVKSFSSQHKITARQYKAVRSLCKKRLSFDTTNLLERMFWTSNHISKMLGDNIKNNNKNKL